MAKAKFSSTNNYGTTLDFEDDVYTVEEFINQCKAGAFTDYDGDGNPVLADKTILDHICVMPSMLYNIPPEATYVIWYNR